VGKKHFKKIQKTHTPTKRGSVSPKNHENIDWKNLKKYLYYHQFIAGHNTVPKFLL
jgi:hypothetical protein